MAVKEVVTTKRRCGYRKKGGCYLVGEMVLGGTLDPCTPIDPPIPYIPPEGTDPNMRSYIWVDISDILEGKPYDEYIRGETAERRSRTIVKEPEIEAFGMPMDERKAIGLCRNHGLEALAKLGPKGFGGAGYVLGHLAGSLNASADAERRKAVRFNQARDYPAVLAALWRMAKKLSPGSRTQRNINSIASAMTAIGAREDGLWLIMEDQSGEN